MTLTPTLEDLATFVDPDSPVLTPDAAQVVYMATSTPADGPRVSELWIRPVPPTTGTARQLTSGARDSAPAIAPDGRTISFVRHDEKGPNLVTIPVGGGPARQLTEGLKVTGAPAFSPDGTAIVFAALVDDRESDPPAPLVVDGDPEHKVDGAGWIGTARTQVYVVPSGGGKPVRLTESGHCTAPAWSPTGDRIAFSQATVDTSEARFCRRIGLVDPQQPRTSVTFPFSPVGVGGPLTWTPDGEAVIAVGTETLTVGLNRLLRLDVDSGGTTVLTAGLDRNVMGGAPGYPGGAPTFASDGRLYFCIRDGGQSVLCSLVVGGQEVRRHDVGEGTVVSALSVVGSTAVVRLSDATTPGELAVIDLGTGQVARATDHLAQALPDVAFLPTTARAFRISDGVTVHGWLLRDPATRGPAPTLLDVHGGPHNAWTGAADTAHLYHQLLAAAGWNVLTLNPRGSDGYGQDFFRAALGAWGEGDQQDFLEPLDQLVAEGTADPGRLAVAGYSYGGFITCWLTSHTEWFRAGVAGGLVSEHHAMNASSDMGAFLFDLEIGDAEAGVRLSPLTYVEQVRTPTLVLHGQDDLRCPLDQAELWFTRLRDNGVPTRMVIYPGGSHTFFLDGPLSHRQDFNERIVDWVERYTS